MTEVPDVSQYNIEFCSCASASTESSSSAPLASTASSSSASLASTASYSSAPLASSASSSSAPLASTASSSSAPFASPASSTCSAACFRGKHWSPWTFRRSPGLSSPCKMIIMCWAEISWTLTTTLVCLRWFIICQKLLNIYKCSIKLG
jgi:hypothetical protein